jgi:thiosulfate/3-mercaptopyruvate sulfurtransferase
MFIDSLPKGVLIDSRSPAAYAEGHLEGALNLDLSGFHGRLRTPQELSGLEESLAQINGRLGLGEDQLVAVYDSGLSTRLAKTAFMLALGGLNVALWPQGWEALATSTAVPMVQPITPWARLNREILATADEVLAQTVIDVRETYEYASGHIPGARNIPLGNFSPINAEALEIPAQVTVHCRSGARSSSVFWLLKHQGIAVKNYLGSMLEWETQEDLATEV